MYSVILSTYKKNRMGILRAVPWSYMVSRVVTGITQIVFPYFLYRYYMQGRVSGTFLAYTGGADYITYVVLGAALDVLAVATLMNVGRALITELREGTLESLLISPMSRTAYFLGCFLEQTTRALLEFGAVLLVGVLLGAKPAYFFSVQTLLALFLAMFSFFCMGLALSSLMLKTRDTYLTQNTLFISMSLVCGISFPVQYLPMWVRHISRLFPLTPAVELFRSAVMQRQGLSANLPLIRETVLVSLIYLLAGIISYRRMEPRLMESMFG